MNQKRFFEGGGEKPHRLSRGDKLGLLDRVVLPTVKGTSPGSLLHMLRVIDGFCGNYRHCVVKRETLAVRARVSVRQAQRLINGLAALGVVAVEHLSNRDGHRIASRYLPNWPAIEQLAGAPENGRGQSATVALRPPEPECHGVTPECHGVTPECHGVTPECHGGTALDPYLDPSIDPPPPKSPTPRFTVERRATPRKEAGEEAIFGLKAEDVRDLPSQVRAFRRLVEASERESSKLGAATIDLTRDRESLGAFLGLVQATDREAKALAGTPGKFWDWLAVLNRRLREPRVLWRGWVTPVESENGHRQADLIIRSAGDNWRQFVEGAATR